MGISFVEKYKNLSNEELAAVAQAGDGDAGVVLLQRCTSLIKKRAFKFYNGSIEMEDLMQEGIIALYQGIKSYNPESASFSTFATLCVDRALISVVRAHSRKKHIPKDKLVRLEDMASIASSSNPEDMLIDNEDASALSHNLRKLLSKLEYKTLMLYLHNYSVSDIAEELSLTQRSVNNALYRIRQKLSHL